MANHKGNQGRPDNTGKTYKRRVFDPRVDIFKQFYLSPSSYTFMNIRQSALRAGYTDQYARNISVQRPKWWLELIDSAEYNRAEMVKKSESHFINMLETPDTTDDRERIKLKQRTAEFVTERLGKDIYSTRQEVTGADGRRLFDVKDRDSKQAPLSTLFKGVKAKE